MSEEVPLDDDTEITDGVSKNLEFDKKVAMFQHLPQTKRFSELWFVTSVTKLCLCVVY